MIENKGDVQSCNNYKSIKLMNRAKKLYAKEFFKIEEVGFLLRKNTTDGRRVFMEKYREGWKLELHCVIVDLEKTYGRVPEEESLYRMRESAVTEKFVRVEQDT